MHAAILLSLLIFISFQTVLAQLDVFNKFSSKLDITSGQFLVSERLKSGEIYIHGVNKSLHAMQLRFVKIYHATCNVAVNNKVY